VQFSPRGLRILLAPTEIRPPPSQRKLPLRGQPGVLFEPCDKILGLPQPLDQFRISLQPFGLPQPLAQLGVLPKPFDQYRVLWKLGGGGGLGDVSGSRRSILRSGTNYTSTCLVVILGEFLGRRQPHVVRGIIRGPLYLRKESLAHVDAPASKRVNYKRRLGPGEFLSARRAIYPNALELRPDLFEKI
jgi:hypothetical protein